MPVKKGTVYTPEILSHTRMSTFMNCPRQYNYHYLQRCRLKYNTANKQFGKAIHDCMDIYYNGVSQSHSLEIAKGIVLEAFRAIWEDYQNENGVPINYKEKESCEGFRELGEAMLGNYLDTYHGKDNWEILETEVTFLIPLRNPLTGRTLRKYSVTGRIDLIGRDLDTGEVFILDHKTMGKEYDLEMLNDDQQITLYWAGATTGLGYPIKKAYLNILYKKKDCPVERNVSFRTQEQIDILFTDLLETTHAIRSQVNYRNDGFHCRACDYREICKARKQDNYVWTN